MASADNTLIDILTVLTGDSESMKKRVSEFRDAIVEHNSKLAEIKQREEKLAADDAAIEKAHAEAVALQEKNDKRHKELNDRQAINEAHEARLQKRELETSARHKAKEKELSDRETDVSRRERDATENEGRLGSLRHELEGRQASISSREEKAREYARILMG